MINVCWSCVTSWYMLGTVCLLALRKKINKKKELKDEDNKEEDGHHLEVAAIRCKQEGLTARPVLGDVD